MLNIANLLRPATVLLQFGVKLSEPSGASEGFDWWIELLHAQLLNFKKQFVGKCNQRCNEPCDTPTTVNRLMKGRKTWGTKHQKQKESRETSIEQIEGAQLGTFLL
jgi:hypothetical protein